MTATFHRFFFFCRLFYFYFTYLLLFILALIFLYRHVTQHNTIVAGNLEQDPRSAKTAMASAPPSPLAARRPHLAHTPAPSAPSAPLSAPPPTPPPRGVLGGVLPPKAVWLCPKRLRGASSTRRRECVCVVLKNSSVCHSMIPTCYEATDASMIALMFIQIYE
jgi:hypothetical protein